MFSFLDEKNIHNIKESVFVSICALEVVRQAHDLGYKEQNNNKF